MKICIFEEDIDKVENLYPLTLTRPVFELKCGYTTLSERITRNFEGTEIYFFLREYLVPTFKNRTGANVITTPQPPFRRGSIIDGNSIQSDDFLFINGRWLMNKGELELDGPEEIGVCGEEVAYIRAKQQTIQSCLAYTPEEFYSNLDAKLPKKEVKATLISYPWDLISNNPDAMMTDFEFLGKKGVLGEFAELSTIYGGSKDDVYVAESAQIQPLVVLDVTHGPIFIDEEAVIFPHTRIEGPAYIGKDTRIVGGKIREGTSIGPVCRVGGEVEEAIIHGYSNKYHDGFLGHAYVGEWVNLGALTTNSDLKNDYTTVEVYIKGKLMDSDDTKVGCFIGDHTKTGLGTFFNTGTVVGVMSNVLPAGVLLPKLIPSFCIAHEGRFLRGRMKDLLTTAKTAMGRRDVELTQEDIQLFEKLYELTKEERNEWIKRTRR